MRGAGATKQTDEICSQKLEVLFKVDCGGNRKTISQRCQVTEREKLRSNKLAARKANLNLRRPNDHSPTPLLMLMR